MKRKFLYILLLINIFIISFVGLKACANSEMSIKIIGGSEIYEVSDFSLSDYKVEITYEDGSVHETELLLSYIRESDRIKLQQVGTHIITVEYGIATTTFTVTLDGPEITGVVFNDKSATFNNSAISLKVENLPIDAQVSYYPACEFIKTGTYQIQANITRIGYKNLTLYANLTILKLEITKPESINDSYIFSGTDISYNIPYSKFYTIENNIHKNAGNYIVDVSLNYPEDTCWTDLSTDNLNYNFEIQKADYDYSSLRFVNQAFLYDGNEHSNLLLSSLPEDIIAQYENNNKIEKGNYLVSVGFLITSSNYNQTDFKLNANMYICDSNELYSVVFKQNGQEDKTVYVKKGENFNSFLGISVKTKVGYNVKWDITDLNSINTDTIVNAVEIPKSFYINIKYNNGTTDGRVSVEYDGDYNLIIPQKQGYQFKNYTKIDGSEFLISGKYTESRNILLYANYDEEKIKINFPDLLLTDIPADRRNEFFNDEEGIYFECYKNTAFKYFSPIRNGYTFICFTDEEGYYFDINSNYIFNTSIKIKTIFKPKQNNKSILTFIEDNVKPQCIYVTYDAFLLNSNIPIIQNSKRGYNLVWNYDFTKTITSDSLIFVKEDPKQIKVFYNIPKEKIMIYAKKYNLYLNTTTDMYYQIITFGKSYKIIDKIDDPNYNLIEFVNSDNVVVKSGNFFNYEQNITLSPHVKLKEDWSEEK